MSDSREPVQVEVVCLYDVVVYDEHSKLSASEIGHDIASSLRSTGVRGYASSKGNATQRKVSVRNPDLHIAKGTVIERVARLIWWLESANEDHWNRFIDDYRERARKAVTEPDGYLITPHQR